MNTCSQFQNIGINAEILQIQINEQLMNSCAMIIRQIKNLKELITNILKIFQNVPLDQDVIFSENEQAQIVNSIKNLLKDFMDNFYLQDSKQFSFEGQVEEIQQLQAQINIAERNIRKIFDEPTESKIGSKGIGYLKEMYIQQLQEENNLNAQNQKDIYLDEHDKNLDSEQQGEAKSNFIRCSQCEINDQAEKKCKSLMKNIKRLQSSLKDQKLFYSKQQLFASEIVLQLCGFQFENSIYDKLCQTLLTLCKQNSG